MIASPPALAGAVNATDSWDSPRVATAPLGAPGTVAGITPFDPAEGAPTPAWFTAETVHVYDAPLVRPETVIGLDEADSLPVAPPFDDVHVAV